MFWSFWNFLTLKFLFWLNFNKFLPKYFHQESIILILFLSCISYKKYLSLFWLLEKCFFFPNLKIKFCFLVCFLWHLSVFELNKYNRPTKNKRNQRKKGPYHTKKCQKHIISIKKFYYSYNKYCQLLRKKLHINIT